MSKSPIGRLLAALLAIGLLAAACGDDEPAGTAAVDTAAVDQARAEAEAAQAMADEAQAMADEAASEAATAYVLRLRNGRGQERVGVMLTRPYRCSTCCAQASISGLRRSSMSERW